MREAHAMLDERIEIRRLEQRAAKRVQTVGAMIVGMDVKDIWLGSRGSAKRGDGNHEKCGSDKCEKVLHDFYFTESSPTAKLQPIARQVKNQFSPEAYSPKNRCRRKAWYRGSDTREIS
jgi:hypothetical protein